MVTSDPSDPRAIALLNAYDHATLLTPPSARNPHFDLPAGYAVGAALTALRRERGERTVGRKIGFTNAAIWAEYGVSAPLWAHVYATTVLHAPRCTATVSLAGRVAPQIEPELVLGLHSAPTLDQADPEALLGTVAWVALGFELVDCHFPAWRFTLADAVADFGLHAQLIIGPPIPLPAAEPAAVLAALSSCTLSLYRDEAVIATGVGANALGSPVHALSHLVHTLAQHGDNPLTAGEVVTTGTLTPAFPCAPGQRWVTEVVGLPGEPTAQRLELVLAPAE